MYWSMKASGAFAAHFANISGFASPSFIGRSKYSGGFFGFGDHAAAVASVARAMKGKPAESAGVFTASKALINSGFVGAGRADRQHGLMMYRPPNTSACFIPIRVAPYPPIECPTSPRLSRFGIVR